MTFSKSLSKADVPPNLPVPRLPPPPQAGQGHPMNSQLHGAQAGGPDAGLPGAHVPGTVGWLGTPLARPWVAPVCSEGGQGTNLSLSRRPDPFRDVKGQETGAREMFLIKRQQMSITREVSQKALVFLFRFSVFKILVPPLAAAYISGLLPLVISCGFYDGR